MDQFFASFIHIYLVYVTTFRYVDTSQKENLTGIPCIWQFLLGLIFVEFTTAPKLLKINSVKSKDII